MDPSQVADQPDAPPPPMAPDRGALPSTPGPPHTSPPPFVFALGRVEPRFPSLALEKEFAQASGRAETAGQTDRQVLHSVLADRANRYLARQMCWVLTIEGLDTYILLPRDPADVELLIEAIRPGSGDLDVDVVIGVRGPIAPPDACSGLLVPVVVFDQLYSFDRGELIREIPRPEDIPDEEFDATAAELFDRIMQIADNAGAIDEHRALNYLAVRYPAIYARTAESYRAEYSLSGIDVRPSRLSGARKVADVVLSFTHRRTDVTERYFTRVDVSSEWPFLVTKLSPFFER